MCISKITNGYDSITSTNYTDTINDYYDMTLFNGTKSETNNDIILPTLILTIPCGLSFLC